MGSADFIHNRQEFTTGPLTLDEMIKLYSIIDNPSKATDIRRALRFYEMPDYEDYQWGNMKELMLTLKHYAFPQNKNEVKAMLKLVAGSKAVLEIGSSFGGTLKHLASVLPKGATIVSVDMPSEETPTYLNAQASLKEVCRQLSILGANVQLFLGDSHASSLVHAIEGYAPYDFIFIDGDHTYEGVKKDWENYGQLGRIVAFHDIAGVVPGVKRFWDEIKESGLHVEEIIDKPETGQFGIGIVYRE